MSFPTANLATVFLFAGVVCNVGCSSTQGLPGKMKAFVTRTPVDKLDPLLDESGELSAEYRVAKKQLKRADDTMLKFARWREDLGDYQKAKEHYREILTDNPHNLEARLGLARIEFATGRVTEAQAILAATARKHPDSPEVWMEQGRIYSSREEWGPAIENLEKAVAIAPSGNSALLKATRYELGLALARNDRAEEARAHLTSAVGASAALFNIGFVLHEQGRNQEASHWFQRALDSHPDDRTRFQSTQMLTKLGFGDSEEKTQLAEWPKQESTVNVSLTSYEEHHETPGITITPTAPQNTAGTPGTSGSSFVSQAAGHVSARPAISQPSSIPAMTPQPNSNRSSSPATPRWNGRSSTGPSVTSQLGNSASEIIAPPQWRARR